MKSEGKIFLRPAGQGDLPQILELFVTTIENSCANDYTASEIKAWTASIESWTKWEGRISRQCFLLALTEAELIGFASLEGNYFDCLYVHHNYHRKGIASLLYKALEQQGFDDGHRELFSDVSYTARPFFEKQGFEVMRKNYNRIRGEVLVNFKMKKSLD